jgi:MFS superfamily sulfate permease-like transporter
MEKKTRAGWSVLPARRTPTRYGGALLRRDLVAGLTVAAVAVPQALAYALLAGVSPEVGLYTAIVMTALGSLFGSSAYLINGPTNALALVVFGVVAGVGAGPDDPGRVGLVALLAVLAGLIQIALALLKLGGLARHVSEAVVLGFMAGAGLLVALTQVPTVLGLPSAGTATDHLLHRLWLTCCRGGPADLRALAVCLTTVALIAGLHRLGGRLKVTIPAMLLSLALVSALVGLLDLASPLTLPSPPSDGGEGRVRGGTATSSGRSPAAASAAAWLAGNLPISQAPNRAALVSRYRLVSASSRRFSLMRLAGPVSCRMKASDRKTKASSPLSPVGNTVRM